MSRSIASIIALLMLLAACGGSGAQSAGPVTTRPGDTPVTSAPPTTTTTVAAGSTSPDTDGGTTSTVPPPATSVPSSTDGEVFVDVFLVRDSTSAVAVPRPVDGTSVASGAIEHLIAGPSAAEHDEGLASAVPSDTLLLGLTIEDGTATVDLSQEFERGGGSTNILSRLAQVVYTLTQFDSVDRVVFWLDGEPVDTFSGEGVVLSDPVDRDDFASVLPIGASPTAAGRWTQDDLPATAGIDPDDLGIVVLVASDDTLNVRDVAGIDGEVVGMLVPGVTVVRTGAETTVGSSRWVEIRTPDGLGWVNGTFLGAVVPPETFEADPDVTALLDEFAATLTANGDISDQVSSRGLYVAHHASPVRFDTEVLSGLMTDKTTYQWPSAALEPGSPENPYRTFAEAVGDKFVSAYGDTDTVVGFNTVVEGPNGRPADMAIPSELGGFNHVTVHDPGDNPDYGGLDWVTWYVSIDYEDGAPRIVALTIDEWSP